MSDPITTPDRSAYFRPVDPNPPMLSAEEIGFIHNAYVYGDCQPSQIDMESLCLMALSFLDLQDKGLAALGCIKEKGTCNG